ncbi:AAT family amino acid transporter, variant [Xylona heveae TC161]|uniref:AAT family amino acid transporter, variant n=1 Tax=Xylona heveae (strain CBS 132557 / TC161) TaxID=1328760 RepID=A0A165JE43_XYLHT|nr:AAT family amino acid transporter, variant [Xylona heveae TC161]KZF26119.1 AAT family amino acid transporter, variant [Xylona heveae TC161]
MSIQGDLPKKQEPIELQQPLDVQEAEIIEYNEDRNGQFHRSFSPRHVHIISLGSNIGSGILIGTGQALSLAGPGNMVIAYALVCSMVWAVLQTLSEMTIAFPTPGNYIDYAERWVDSSLAFGAGFAEWLAWIATVGAEATFFNVLIQYWARGNLPLAASLAIFLAVNSVLFLLPNKAFAWFEYVTSLIKITLLLIIITVSLAMVCGAGPRGYVHHGEYWKDLPVFKNGFTGFAHAALLASWAVGDQIFIGIMGGEAQSPRFSLGHATKLVPFRVNIIYMLCVMFITLLVPSNDDRLMGGSGVTASPFIIALNDAGIPVLPHIMNAAMIASVMAISAESIYLSSRILRTMAHKRLIPEVFAKVDDAGRPRWALLITCAVAVLLTFMNLSSGGSKAFTWLISISSACYFVNWIVISISSWQFRRALKAQNDNLFSQPYAWKSSLWPLAPTWLFVISLLLIACCFIAGINPGGDGFDATNFFQYIFGLLLIFGFTAIHKAIYRTPLRNPKTADCVTGRHELSAEELIELDTYSRLSRWRRFLTYVQLW